ncbi:hypothetical protein LAV84_27655 [Rhizobium sp. VS19-DR104.2]|uniref:hypothetical protein n=1 Tax=unclassified Rhizobium TaxID=2613769 RepID=UPI001CC3A3DA|nr:MULTISPECIES: hypothetical protein [unclassified Rhizobium]MBZ5763042.1 hypothetical protein [Rhizobium sp. VS19-DR96]MBZ5768821.1 hypothetical protein [Rhizobium sp. VS19-DR129.2]MBZ5776350.1 hypothetical protein [Rhizobium sp. VS19-DRK62.2]MBZ5787558.1 hypothetical protein [Rhizobium sp. VS19-DR121]MBZ5804913.1 hypothetical protein [Rhizobium sp. VS19-DR181]
MTKGRAYYLDEQRFTPSQFRRLSRSRQVEAMVQWFGGNYEDPANRTPYNTREGGYQFIGGGPFDADEEIQEHFSDVAEFETMQEAVTEVTSDGIYDWAPTDNGAGENEDYPLGEDDRGFELAGDTYRGFGVTGEVDFVAPAADRFSDEVKDDPLVAPARAEDIFAARVRAFHYLDLITAEITNTFANAAVRGHNRPPELLEDEVPDALARSEEVKAAIADIRAEDATGLPNPEVIKAKASVIRRFAAWVFEQTANNAIGAIGVSALTGAASWAWQKSDALFHVATQAADAVTAWANLMPPLY